MQEKLYRCCTAIDLAVCMRQASGRVEAQEELQLRFIKIFDRTNNFRGEGSFEDSADRSLSD